MEDKLDALAASARHDVCLATCSSNLQGGVGRFRDPQDPLSRWIYPAVVPGKGKVGILKILLTNACRNNCTYCSLSTRCDSERRVGFAPRELADVFMEFVRRKMVHGLFLSSGVGSNTDAVMERMIRTAEILRVQYGFRDYIHLKMLPGVSYRLIQRAALFADRISVNLEAPTPEHLMDIAPEKDFIKDLLLRMKWAGDLLRSKHESGDRSLQLSSQTTQFVVGAAGESDIHILKAVDWIYRELFVFRSYYSAYQKARSDERTPSSEQALLDPMEHRHRSPLLREHRLYQSDFLLRGYGFRFSDLVFDENGRVPADVDPKTAYAALHPERYPVDVNRAEEPDLLKVPGIGPLSARRIVQGRQKEPLHQLSDLKRIGAWSRRAAPYIEFSGRRPDVDGAADLQGWLFEKPGETKWQTNLAPYQKEKITAMPSTPGSISPEHTGSGTSKQTDSSSPLYNYPGQKGKPYVYVTSKSQRALTCR